MVLRKYTAMLAMLTCCSVWGVNLNEYSAYKTIQESVESSVLDRQSKFDLICQVKNLSATLEKTKAELVVCQTVLENTRQQMRKGFDDLQEDIERSSSVSGFFGSIWRTIFGGNNPIGREINRLRGLLN